MLTEAQWDQLDAIIADHADVSPAVGNDEYVLADAVQI